MSQTWWFSRFIISTFERARQEDQKFETSLDYIVRSCLEKKIGEMILAP